jgi:hypothetical protein
MGKNHYKYLLCDVCNSAYFTEWGWVWVNKDSMLHVDEDCDKSSALIYAHTVILRDNK